MSLENLSNKLPEYAKDLRLNLSTLIRDTKLNKQQLWGLILCSALTTRSEKLISEINEESRENLGEEAFNAACGAASIMGMNNVYYRFTHTVENKEYSEMSAKLRMSIIAKHGVEKVDFELWSLAASAITGCGMCMNSHEAHLRELGVDSETIAESIRIAAVINGVSVALA